VAVRGLGGFLLAVAASSAEAVRRRQRKRRPAKPFALMARDLGVVARYLGLTDEAARLLESPQAPIVVLPLPARAWSDGRLPWTCSRRHETIGVMLPTTALHALLFTPLCGDDASTSSS